MATFTLTQIDTTVPSPQVMGTMKCAFVNVAVSGNYTDEGDALTPARFGMTKVLFFQAEPAVATDGETGVLVRYDYTNNKVMMYEGGAAGAAYAEKTASEAVPTGLSFRCQVWGI